MRPFLFLGTRAEDEVADGEYAAMRSFGGLREEEHRIAEPEHPLHGAEHDLEDLFEIQRRRDLGGDLLDDANVVRPLREVLVEAVDRLLVPGDPRAEPVQIGHRRQPLAGGIRDSGIRSPRVFVTDTTR